MEIDWKSIKDGFRGFEKLALVYAKSKFENPSWKKTNETRDGNKDAIAYVFGYCSQKSEKEQWWMEAKFSTKQTVVTRYRLDATIVSAILNDNVKKVIFVTNIAVRAKTIIDIRNALTKSTSCSDVIFYTKPILENWLCKNHHIYEEFFPPLDTGDTLKQSEGMYLTQEIDFYHRGSIPVVFAEPIKNLYCNNHYIGHFSIYSEEEKNVTLRKGRNCRGISLIGQKTFALHEGENSIKFEFIVSSKPPDENSFYFLLDNIEVFPANVVRFLSQCNIHHELPGQKEIVSHLQETLKDFLKRNYCEFFAISAASGSGKTEMLEQLSSTKFLTNEYLFYRSFSFSDTDNSLIIVDFILFLLFPYLSPNEIDIDYINKIGITDTIRQVYELVRLRKNYNELINFLLQECTPKDFLPDSMKINARIVFLDNLHYLSDPLFFFFKKLMIELKNRKIPIYMIVTIDTITLYQERWKDLISCCDIEVQQFQLGLEDIVAVMGGTLQVKETTKNLLQSGNLTALELFSFAKYIFSESYAIETTEQLLATLRIFQHSDVLGKEIRTKFINLFNQYPNCRTICDYIFSSYSPVKDYENFSSEVNALVEKDLIKYDMYNCLIPQNEYVREYYHNFFGIRTRQNATFTSDEDHLRADLENGQMPSVLCKAANKIIDLTNNKQYNAVIYIGKKIFECEASRNELENRMKNRILFLKMYFCYSYAAHMQSNVENPRTHFECIINRCKASRNSQMLSLCLRAQWELANNDFENLRYGDVLEDVMAGIETLKKMRKYEVFSNGINKQLKFHDFMAIRSFVKSELGELDSNNTFTLKVEDTLNSDFADRYYNTKIRLALTKITVNTHDSLDALNEGTQYFREKYNCKHKMFYFGEFSRLYFEMVIKNQVSNLEILTEIHEKMKAQQHNNYRKRNFALATYYYWMGDIETGNRYLFSEIFTIRNLSRRATGFYHETMALHQLRNYNRQQALYSLKQAQEVFGTIEVYSKIIEHNITVLDTMPLEKIAIQFWKGEPFRPDTYYLDLRITW